MQDKNITSLLMTILVPVFSAMISYNIITGDTLSKVFQRLPGGR